MKLLLLRNADVLIENNAGSTPRDFAVRLVGGPIRSSTSALLEEEVAWRRYLQQSRPCTVRQGGSSSALSGIVASSGSAVVHFDALSATMCLEASPCQSSQRWNLANCESPASPLTFVA